MNSIYSQIIQAKAENRKLLALLLDPDKIDWQMIVALVSKINESPATHVFIGGSEVNSSRIDDLVLYVKEQCRLPVLLFPGNPSQISKEADGILFLSLISGRNPDYLIHHQIEAVPILEETDLEIISTGYILIESGGTTAVERISMTQPISRTSIDFVAHTAKAGELIGNKLIYLEAGSGAKLPVPLDIIARVSQKIVVPLIVGGGIRSKKEIEAAQHAGADLVVIGTAFENDINFFDQL